MKAFKDLKIGDTIYILYYGYVVHEDDIDVVLKKIRSAKVTFVEEYHSAIRLSYHTSTYGRTVFVPSDNCFTEGNTSAFISTGPEILIGENTDPPVGENKPLIKNYNECSRAQLVYLKDRVYINEQSKILNYCGNPR